MGLVQDENVAQTLFLGRFDSAFGVRIGVGRPIGSGNNVHAFIAEDSVESLGELGVIVADQEAWGEFTFSEVCRPCVSAGRSISGEPVGDANQAPFRAGRCG
jgi:hypothetical protein